LRIFAGFSIAFVCVALVGVVVDTGIVAGLLAPGSGRSRRSVRIALLVIAYILQNLPHGGPQWSGIDWFQALGARLWATLLLGVGVVMTLHAVRARPADAQVDRSQAVPTAAIVSKPSTHSAMIRHDSRPSGSL
jgi:hypothetical protein